MSNASVNIAGLEAARLYERLNKDADLCVRGNTPTAVFARDPAAFALPPSRSPRRRRNPPSPPSPQVVGHLRRQRRGLRVH